MFSKSRNLSGIDLKPTLLERSRVDLNEIAKKLRIKNFGHGDKEQLVDTILSRRSAKQIRQVVFPSFWNAYHNHIYGLSSIVGVLLAVLTLFPRPTREERTQPQQSEAIRHVAPTPRPAQPVLEFSSSLSSKPEPEPKSTLEATRRRLLPKKVPVSVHIDRARSLLSQELFPSALTECNLALNSDPGNRTAMELKRSILALAKLRGQSL